MRKTTFTGVGKALWLFMLTVLFACGGGTDDGAEGTVASAVDSATAVVPMPASTSELAYMEQFAGKQVWNDTVLESEPFNSRLKALLGSMHPNLLRHMADLGPPVAADEHTVTISGCKQHDCAATGGIILIDLTMDNILVGYRVDNKVATYTEKPMGNGYPQAFTEWAGTDPVSEGRTTGGKPDAAATGAFKWISWEKVPDDLREQLKRTRWGRGETEYGSIEVAVRSGCNVQVAQHDLNGDGTPGIIVSKADCELYCGSAGCNLKAFDGGRKLSVNDQVDRVRPAKNGVVTSVGVLIPLE
ncbi:MAG TPA: hypothetical protein PLB89_10450 [Flavobacteriales bacterium]|nr:hypothetical protein [Flavobacteriales bacterium]